MSDERYGGTRAPVLTPEDWATSDPRTAFRLGEALSKQGYVVWRSRPLFWTVIDPLVENYHHAVRIDPNGRGQDEPWSRLTCTCLPHNDPSGVCVHKAAVHHHATQLCEFSYYHQEY